MEEGGEASEIDNRFLVDLKWEGARSEGVCKRMLFGKVITDKMLNRATVKSMIQRVWSIPQGLVIAEAGLSMENAIRLGEKIGVVTEVEDCWEEEAMVRSFLRARVRIDVRNPLSVGLWVPRPNLPKLWIEVKNEKLQNVCFGCGVIGHDIKSCVSETSRGVSEDFYGPWMGTAPLKQVGKVFRVSGGKIIEGSSEHPEPARESHRGGRESGQMRREKVSYLCPGSSGHSGLRWHMGKPVDVSCEGEDSGIRQISQEEQVEATWRDNKECKPMVISPVKKDFGPVHESPTERKEEEHEDEGHNDRLELVSLAVPRYEENLVKELKKVNLKRKAEEVQQLEGKRGRQSVSNDVEMVNLPIFKTGSGRSPRKKYNAGTRGRGRGGRKSQRGDFCPSVLVDEGSLVEVPIIEESNGRMEIVPGTELAENGGAKALKDVIRKVKPSLIFLMEIRCSIKKAEKTRKRSFRDSKYFYVNPSGLSGGLGLWWSEEVDVQIFESSKNFIHAFVISNSLGFSSFISFIYGPPIAKDREKVWDKIRGLAPKDDDPWACIGDFNELSSPAEKVGGKEVRARSLLRFHSFLNDCNLMDVSFNGSKFTWTNKQIGDAHVKERLDRAVCNVSFREVFQRAQLIHQDFIGSDHCPIVLFFDFKDKKTLWCFKFEQMWTEHPGFKNLIASAWRGDPSQVGDEMGRFLFKLNGCKQILTNWSLREFPNNLRAIERLKRVIKECMEGELTKDNRRKAEEAQGEINKLWKREESYWAQRARVNWIRAGDKNTRFFHSSTIRRRQKNKILREKNSEGVWVEEEEEIAKCFENFYGNLFASEGDRDFSDVLECVDKVVSEEDNAFLSKQITMEEVRQAVFDLGDLKAPGPDGFSGLFFRKSWDSIANSVFLMVKEFFEKGDSLVRINDTNLILIPKIDSPEEVGHFRPISLCNFSYKIIAKIVANRMRGILPGFISENQRTFVLGRMIQDNILIVHEAFHWLKRKKKGGQGVLALKMDMNKAYDRVEWDFLRCVLSKLGFSDIGVKLARSCPWFTHSFFADDAMFFLKASKENCEVMASILQAYCKASGQCPNLEKSSKKGSKASWAWSSLLEGRDLLAEGLGWCVGNGRSISFWKDAWIPGLPNYKLVTAPRENLDDLQKVSDFIVDGGRDLEKLIHCVSGREVVEILKIPISGRGREDRFTWLKTRNGSYAVKSRYHVYKNRVKPSALLKPSCSTVVSRDLWKDIWGLKVPPKVKHFLWRLCNGALSSKENLFKRKCASDPICPICGLESETLEHLFMYCDAAKRSWFVSPLSLKMDLLKVCRVEDWLACVFAKNSTLDDWDKAILACTCWQIWKSRCSLVFQGEGLVPFQVARRACAMAEEFWLVNNFPLSLPGGSVLHLGKEKASWVRPERNMIKINCDGAFSEDSGEAGIGVVARDHKASIIVGWMKVALPLPLLWLKLLPARKQWSWDLVSVHGATSFSWISRDANSVANWLALNAKWGVCPYGWVCKPPPPLALLLDQDAKCGVG
ncbi:reverse transcriptase [Senna tora]|uniref:Reverse transcriptase n=1 Tax=Senna tora TaxID=362788 RepID=A0A834TJW6_9FABA|nr:reverse transcriptase [Senna tora]